MGNWFLALFGGDNSQGLIFKINQVSVLLLILLVPSIYKSMETLHYNREGFRQAGKWLAMNSKPGDPVEDPFCWSHYYAGKVFLEGAMDLRFSEPRVKYVIVERSGNPHLRLNTQDEESLKAQQGKVVYDWACKRKGVHSTVVVYEIPVR